MRIFHIKFNIGSLELEAIVTESGESHRFKVELVTGEPDPIILRKSNEGWVIEQFGGRTLPTDAFKTIEKEIDAKLPDLNG